MLGFVLSPRQGGSCVLGSRGRTIHLRAEVQSRFYPDPSKSSTLSSRAG